MFVTRCLVHNWKWSFKNIVVVNVIAELKSRRKPITGSYSISVRDWWLTQQKKNSTMQTVLSAMSSLISSDDFFIQIFSDISAQNMFVSGINVLADQKNIADKFRIR